VAGQFHSCKSGQQWMFECYSHEGILVLDVNREYYVEVKYCPFCGFSMPVKEED
jgi:hypothetical protein